MLMETEISELLLTPQETTPPPPPPQLPHPPQPILRKKPHTDGVVNHVRIVPAPTSCDGDDDPGDQESRAAPEPWVDRENPFRPGSDLDREADSLLRNSRISRHSVHLPQTPTTPTVAAAASAAVTAASPEAASDGDPRVREDTVSLLAPSTAVAAVIPDDATDSGPDCEADEAPLVAAVTTAVASSAPAPDANGSTVADPAKPRQADAVISQAAASNSQAPVPSKAEAVQLKGGRACCDLM